MKRMQPFFWLKLRAGHSREPSRPPEKRREAREGREIDQNSFQLQSSVAPLPFHCTAAWPKGAVCQASACPLLPIVFHGVSSYMHKYECVGTAICICKSFGLIDSNCPSTVFIDAQAVWPELSSKQQACACMTVDREVFSKSVSMHGHVCQLITGRG